MYSSKLLGQNLQGTGLSLHARTAGYNSVPVLLLMNKVSRVLITFLCLITGHLQIHVHIFIVNMQMIVPR